MKDAEKVPSKKVMPACSEIRFIDRRRQENSIPPTFGATQDGASFIIAGSAKKKLFSRPGRLPTIPYYIFLFLPHQRAATEPGVRSLELRFDAASFNMARPLDS